MGEDVEKMSAHEVPNVFDQPCQVQIMQSELGVAGALHGALVTGSLSSTFTCSQGLLLMIPNMYKISGELHPCVFHVASRSLAGQGITMFGDHSDVMAVRNTGFSFMSSGTVQECHDFALVSHLATLKTSVPFLHFFEGFRVSHEMQKIRMLSYDAIRKLVDPEDVARYRRRAFHPMNPYEMGSAQNPEIYFQSMERANEFYDAVPQKVDEVMESLAPYFGRRYRLFDYYGSSDAESVIVLMGAGSQAARECVKHLNEKGEKVGLLKVNLFRPWSLSHFMSALPPTTRRVAVLDRVKESGSHYEPLAMDVAASLHDAGRGDISLLGGRYGLASKEFNPAMVNAVFENLKSSHPKNHFTVGIVDDVTGLSLEIPPFPSTVPPGTKECVFWGFGGDGTIGSNKSAIKIIGDNPDMNVQAYFSYDAHKSGGVTWSHLRFGKEEQTSNYLVSTADFIGVHKENYVKKYDVLDPIKEGGTCVINSVRHTAEELDSYLPGHMKRLIAERKVSLYTVDAHGIAERFGLGKHVNWILTAVFFKLSNVLPLEEAVRGMNHEIDALYAKKASEERQRNKGAVQAAIEELCPIQYDPQRWAASPDTQVSVSHKLDQPEKLDPFIRNVMTPVCRLKGNQIPVSAFPPGSLLHHLDLSRSQP
jgi:pyruvate-ferredoxin/flavodoxin oxidoreductase